MDNKSQNKSVSTTLGFIGNFLTHPYHLRWVSEGTQSLFVTQECNISFSIGPQFHDIVLCNVAMLNCIDLMLGILYQHELFATYASRPNTYTLTKDGLHSRFALICHFLSRISIWSMLSFINVYIYVFWEAKSNKVAPLPPPPPTPLETLLSHY